MAQTRNEQVRTNVALGVIVIGGALCWSLGGGVAGWLAGNGWAPALAYPDWPGIRASLGADPGANYIAIRPALAPMWAWAVCSGLLGLAVLLLVVVPLMRRPADPRLRGLGQWRKVRRLLSARAVRRAGRFTRRDLTWWQRHRVPLTELGYRLGRMRDGGDLWASFEVRVRVIARTGWGKTSRLLVWIARDLPGAALIGSTKADLFEQTVRARQRGPRLPRGWRWWQRPRYGPARPVLVVDFSERTRRYAAGFDRVRWNPILGCEDYQLATRRARAIAAGTEDGDRNDDSDGFFRDAAGEVIAAWFHAAALARKDIRDVIRWQQNIRLRNAEDILERHPYAERAALLALEKHLDPKGERTTSSVERFVQLALKPFATYDGEDFIIGGPSVDIAQLIRDRASIYLLASDTTAASVSPILTMFADEWFHTARAVAQEHGGRLPVPAVGVLDELRLLVPIPSLPQVVYEMRSAGVGVVYALQNGRQEEELYGDAAKSLAQNVQCTVVGGYDEYLVDELKDQAGRVAVASPTASGSLMALPDISEGTHWLDTLNGSDLQDLEDGEAVVRVAGARPFYAHVDSFRDHRRLRRRIAAEERDVHLEVVAAQATDAAINESRFAAAQATYERGTVTR